MSITPTTEAEASAPIIREEALKYLGDEGGRPFPLLAYWNSYSYGWSPDFQIDAIQSGYHILPSVLWPTYIDDEDFNDYYSGLFDLCNQLSLPISFRGTQWEEILLDTGVYGSGIDTTQCVVTPTGTNPKLLSPFGPTDVWVDPSGTFVNISGMKTLQSWYPNPPKVVFLSNNEVPKLLWGDAEDQSQRYLNLYGTGRSDEFKREALASGWIERYPIMLSAMKEALVEQDWKDNCVFIGYDAYGVEWMGRYYGWDYKTLYTDEFMTPDWYIWGGASPSYYTHNWSTDTDYTVRSTQISTMNYNFQLDEALDVNSGFWWEVSTWEGDLYWAPGEPCVEHDGHLPKTCQYYDVGQTYDVDRYSGWLKFALWLHRPKSLRIFRDYLATLVEWSGYTEAEINVIEEVYQDELKQEFWRDGVLVTNPSFSHPYNKNIPPQYKSASRNFLLTTSEWPSSWDLENSVGVYAIAYSLGSTPARRWMVFAHSPVDDATDVQIRVPDYGNITVDVPREGAFFFVRESTWSIVELIEGYTYKLEFYTHVDNYLILEHEETRSKVWRLGDSGTSFIDHGEPILTVNRLENVVERVDCYQPKDYDISKGWYSGTLDELKAQSLSTLYVSDQNDVYIVDERSLNNATLNAKRAIDSGLEKTRRHDILD